MLPARDYLDLTQTKHGILFPDDSPVWAALTRIESYLDFRLQRESRVQVPPGAFIGEAVFIDSGPTLEAGAVIKGPAGGRRHLPRGASGAGSGHLFAGGAAVRSGEIPLPHGRRARARLRMSTGLL